MTPSGSSTHMSATSATAQLSTGSLEDTERLAMDSHSPAEDVPFVQLDDISANEGAVEAIPSAESSSEGENLGPLEYPIFRRDVSFGVFSTFSDNKIHTDHLVFPIGNYYLIESYFRDDGQGDSSPLDGEAPGCVVDFDMVCTSLLVYVYVVLKADWRPSFPRT
jgi:hypothetical protein